MVGGNDCSQVTASHQLHSNFAPGVGRNDYSEFYSCDGSDCSLNCSTEAEAKLRNTEISVTLNFCAKHGFATSNDLKLTACQRMALLCFILH